MNQIRHFMPFKLKMSHSISFGLVHAFVWMMLGALGLSMCLWLNRMDEKNVLLYTYLVHSWCLFVGGFISGRKCERKGWYQGGLTGLCYAACLLLIGFLALDASITWIDGGCCIAAFLIASVGGIFGVNTQKK